MKGFKTWTGIIIAILGAIGITDIVGIDNLSGFLDGLITTIGFGLTMYGNYKAHREIKAKGGY